MYKYVDYMRCKSCGATNTYFYAKIRTDRNNKIYVGCKCILCHKEDEAIRNRKYYKNNAEASVARVLKYRSNPDNYKSY